MNEEYVPIHVLQSQLFLLKMLLACMQNHWKHCQNTDSLKRPALNRSDPVPSGSWTPSEGMPKVRIDPPPLEENLARHIIFIMSRFVYQITILDEKEYGLVANHSTSDSSIKTDPNINSPSKIMIDIHKAARAIVAYVSASNWDAVFAKIRNRILYLTTTQEENPKMTDTMLLECVALNHRRLGMVLTGIKKESSLN